MNMRELINLLEVDYFKATMDVPYDFIENVFKKEFWYLDYENQTDLVQIWKHRDDDKLGEYVIYLNEIGHVVGIVYRNLLYKNFNAKFNTFNDFAHHCSEITNDPIYPEDIENARRELMKVRDKLEQNGDEETGYAGEITVDAKKAAIFNDLLYHEGLIQGKSYIWKKRNEKLDVFKFFSKFAYEKAKSLK